jgi:hypothetical protein
MVSDGRWFAQQYSRHGLALTGHIENLLAGVVCEDAGVFNQLCGLSIKQFSVDVC